MSTNANNLEFYYNFTLSYVLDGKEHNIDSSSILNVLVDSDYDNKNMPIVYLIMKLDTDIYNMVIDNDTTGRFSMSCRKYKTIYALKRDVFKGLFEYFIPADRNSRIQTSSDNTTSTNSSNSYKKIVVGLMSADIINANKVPFNEVFSDTNSVSLADAATKHMQMVFEPFVNNYKITEFVVPPIGTVAEFLDYLNYYYPFYPTDYRYFIDFNFTYLLSRSGTYVDPKDGTYKRLNIKISSTELTSEADKGVIVDDTNQIYQINAYVHRTRLKVNRYSQASLSVIKGIDSEGNTLEDNLDLDSMDAKIKYQYQRVANLDAVTVLTSNIEKGAVILEVTKQNMDTTIITPNKIYQVRNSEGNTEYDGAYILSKKQDLFKPSYAGFESYSTMTLTRISD